MGKARGFRPGAGNGGTGGGTLAGDVAGPLLANVIQPGVVTGGAGGKTATRTLTQLNMDSSALPTDNLLTNPSFNFAQLQVPGTLTTIADNAISADAWKLTRENADAQYQRVAMAGLGGNSAFMGSFKKITSAGKMMIYQPLENLLSTSLRNETVSFTVLWNMAIAKAMRLAIFKYTAGAANDVVPAPVSAWNGAGVAPTLNAGFTYLVSFATGVIGAGLSFSNTAVTIGELGVNDTLCIAVISDAQVAINDTVGFGQASLAIGDQGRYTYVPLTPAEDLLRVERFIEKSYSIDVAPATVTLAGAENYNNVGTTALRGIKYRQRKIKAAPTITLYNPNSGAAASWRDTTGAADVAVTTQNGGDAGVTVAPTGPTTNTNAMAGHYLINGSL